MVNLLHQLMKQLDWNLCVNKRGQTGTIANETARKLFGGKVFKLHGNMEHADRKLTYAGFDKAEACCMICTDVASRGLDFKGVSWVLHFDLSSQIKEYVNRVGRTARMANSGKSLAFVMTPCEDGYVEYLNTKYGVQMHSKSRFTLARVFEQQVRLD